MIHLILRRATEAAAAAAASPSSFSCGHAVVAAVSSLETLLLYHQPSIAYIRRLSSRALLDGPPSSYPAGVRRFHGLTLPLGFRETTAASAAMADYGSYAEDRSAKGSGAGGNGLEIAKLGIEEEIVSALAKKGITKLFPIQKAVLDPAMQGRDMIGRARTGTGKTCIWDPNNGQSHKIQCKTWVRFVNQDLLAYSMNTLPNSFLILTYLDMADDTGLFCFVFNRKGRNPLGLILAPTRELARQVEKEFYESASNLDTICVYGGTPIQHQMRQLDYGVDIVVGTPGRVIDLIKRGALNLSEVQFAVLDEADQMLAVGFEEDVETILKNLTQNRQSMMFSATMPNWIKGLARKYLKDPLTIDLVGDSDQKLADGISLYAIASDLYAKASIIGPLLTEHAKGGKCIVFTQTKRDADRLAYAMAKSYRCEALHGDISQAQRERTLSHFREGHFNILVATDVAARGLDIPNVDLVIHYELPNSPEIFVHRSGRTGRAGKKGNAILIYTQDQHRDVRIIEREVGCKFTELPKIAVDGASIDMFSMGGGDRYNSFGGGRDRRSGYFGFGRSQRGSDFGRGGGYPSSNYSGSNSNRFGSFGGRSSGLSGGGFGSSSSNRSGDFGRSSSGRPSGFDDFDSDRRSKSFGDFGSNQRSRFGDFGSESSGGSRSSGLGRSSLFGDNNSSRHDVPGDSSSSRSNSFGGNWNDGDRRSRK